MRRKDRKIITWFAYPPIPIRSNDWAAYRDGDEEDSSRYGWGRTEQAAINDLLLLEEEEEDDGEPDEELRNDRLIHPDVYDARDDE